MLKAHWEVFGGFAALRLIPVFSSRADGLGLRVPPPVRRQPRWIIGNGSGRPWWLLLPVQRGWSTQYRPFRPLTAAS